METCASVQALTQSLRIWPTHCPSLPVSPPDNGSSTNQTLRGAQRFSELHAAAASSGDVTHEARQNHKEHRQPLLLHISAARTG